MVSEIGESHVKVVDSDEAFDARMALELGAAQLVVGKLSPEQLAEYRRLAEATDQHIKDGHFVDPAGFRETNSAFHLFPIEATGNATLVDAYRTAPGPGVHGPRADPVGRTGRRHHQGPRRHRRRLRARTTSKPCGTIIVEHTDHAKATMRAGIEKTGRLS